MTLIRASLIVLAVVVVWAIILAPIVVRGVPS